MSNDLHPYPLGSPGGRVLCSICASRLFVIFKHADRWTVCPLCDAGWSRNADLDTVQRVGPPVLLASERQS